MLRTSSFHSRLHILPRAAVLPIVGLALAGCGESSSPSPDPSASGANTTSTETTTTSEPTNQVTATPPTTNPTTPTTPPAPPTATPPATSASATSSSSSSSEPGPAPSTGVNSSEDGPRETSEGGAQSTSDDVTEPPQLSAKPSAGCSGGNANAAVPSAVVDKPNGYDGSTPVPVLFAFHGAGGNSSSLQGPFASDAKARGYLGVYLKSSGNQWSIQADTAVLNAAYDAVAQNYCVDENRVFAVGHSSGAQMITQLLCAGDRRFRAVAPVASSKYCNRWDATAAIVIHGVDDIERGGQGAMRYGLNDGDGRIDFGVYHSSNQCTEASTPFEPGGNCGANIQPGCVEYDSCAARTVFCNHNDPQYGTSNHGVPCFASKVMFDFFDEFE